MRTLPTELWQRYRTSGDPDARRQLRELYIGLVHHVARDVSRRTDAVELDEMVSAGTFGLLRAIHSFDVSRGLAFSTYAVRRIRGAILTTCGARTGRRARWEQRRAGSRLQRSPSR